MIIQASEVEEVGRDMRNAFITDWRTARIASAASIWGAVWFCIATWSATRGYVELEIWPEPVVAVAVLLSAVVGAGANALLVTVAIQRSGHQVVSGGSL
jgi:hypothetical protein